VGLGGEVNNGPWTMVGQYSGHNSFVAYVSVYEYMIAISPNRPERFQVARIGKGIQIDDAVLAFQDISPHECAANETGPTSD
jgi:hypothetical protein